MIPNHIVWQYMIVTYNIILNFNSDKNKIKIKENRKIK